MSCSFEYYGTPVLHVNYYQYLSVNVLPLRQVQIVTLVIQVRSVATANIEIPIHV